VNKNVFFSIYHQKLHERFTATQQATEKLPDDDVYMSKHVEAVE
jgi:hypothetical protein